VNDLEDRIANALNAHVDHELGSRRPAPPFTPPVRERRRPTWVLPLTVAACVAAIVGGTVAASRLLGKHDEAPGTQHTTVASPTPVPTVPVSDARIALPRGWTVRKAGAPERGWGWCIVRTGAKANACTVSLLRITSAPTEIAQSFDVDSPGVIGDPPQFVCGNVSAPRTETYAVRSFGGQPAQWRRWDADCASTGHSLRIEQWSDASVPTWVMTGSSIDAGSTMSTVMAYVAKHSELRVTTGPYRAMDRGVIRAVHATTAGVRIELDRTVLVRSGGTIRDDNPDPATYDYAVPRAIRTGAHVKVGQRVRLWTDGHTVRKLEPDVPTSS